MFTFCFWCHFNFVVKGGGAGGAGGASSAGLGDKEKTSEEKESECKGSEDGGDGGNKDARDSEVLDSVNVYLIWLFLKLISKLKLKWDNSRIIIIFSF